MAKRKRAALWRPVFLRALKRTGNVRAAAAHAGVDPGTAYDHRHKDAGFAAKWDAAIAEVRARGPLHRAAARRGPPPRPGEELIARRSKSGGVKMVRVAAGRWSARKEMAFLAALRRTGNARLSAKAAGISTTALYNRRRNDPDFAAEWAAAAADSHERVPELLRAATIAALDPDVEGEGLPPVTIEQAIAVARLRGLGKAGGEGGGLKRGPALRSGPRAPTIEEVREEVLRRLAAIRAHRQRREESPLHRPSDGPPPRPGEET